MAEPARHVPSSGFEIESLGVVLKRLVEIAAGECSFAGLHCLFDGRVIGKLDSAARGEFLEKLVLSNG
jgi:hypothetical protein